MNEKVKVKKPFYKRFWFWVIVIILGIIAINSSSDSSSTSSKKSSKASSSSLVSSSSSSAASSSSASPSGQTTDLSTGNGYIVGKDIQPGAYTLTAPSGSGNVMSSNGNLNIILGDGTDGDDTELTSYHAILVKGEKLEIDSIPTVHFEATQVAPQPINSGNLNAGDYTISDKGDIQPGRYTIALVAGSGNLQTNNGDVNEILDSDTSNGGVTQTTVDLRSGEVLSFDAQTISLTKK